MSNPFLTAEVASDYNAMIDSLRRGACLFLGAGISKMAGYPLWEELAQQLLDQFWENRGNIEPKLGESFRYEIKEHLSNCSYPLQVISHLADLDLDLLVETIQTKFRCCEQNIRESHPVTPLVFQRLKCWAEDGKTILVQTNIDRSLEHALGLAEDDVDLKPGEVLPFRKLTYLHGRLDHPKSWIMTQQRYNEVYARGNTPHNRFLAKLFRERDVMFLGYRLREAEVLRNLLATRQTEGPSARRCYCLEGYLTSQQAKMLVERRMFLRDFDITIIPYSISDEGYESLLEELDEINTKVFQLSVSEQVREKEAYVT